MKLRDRQNKIPVELTEKLTASPAEESDRQTLLQNDQALQYMDESINDLNPEQKQCVTLFYLQKKSYQEISDETGYSLMQVKSYIQNGKRNLRSMIEKKMNAK